MYWKPKMDGEIRIKRIFALCPKLCSDTGMKHWLEYVYVKQVKLTDMDGSRYWTNISISKKIWGLIDELGT
jgi:hypothetical protein